MDVHQHLWPPALLDALRARREPPRLVGWRLLLPGQPPFDVQPLDHDASIRAGLDPDVERILLSLSSGLGVEYLPPEESAALLAAWHDGVRALGPPFEGWAATGLVEQDPAGLADVLALDVVGLEVPASAMATPAALERLAPLLDVVQNAGKPVLVHPGLPGGPIRGGGPGQHPAGDVESLPSWWLPVVDYVGQLHAAWWSWTVAGRALLPRLRVCFVAAAGLAPLQRERMVARGGRWTGPDADVFVDTSSYGSLAVDAVVRALGLDAVLLGSDRPYASPPQLGPDMAQVTRAMRIDNPRRFLAAPRPLDRSRQ